jgi:tetratricopeptide (TPR) repeat protein
LFAAAALAIQAQLFDDAQPFAKAASEVDPANQLMAMGRLAVDLKVKSQDATLALTQYATRWPSKLGSLPEETISDTIEAAHRTADPHELDLLASLYAARWKPSDALESASDQWRDLALLLIKAGQPDRALAVTKDITDPYTMISMHADRRFDAIVKAAPERFDVEKAAEAQLDDLRARAAATQDRLEIANGVAVELLRRNHPEEALAVTDQLLKRIGDPTQSSGLVDVNPEAAWTRNYRAYALRDLGRYDEALAELRLAARSSDGQVVPLQADNLAQMLYEQKRPDEALEVLATLPAESGAFRLDLEHDKVCAYAEKGIKDKAGESLAYLREQSNEALDAVSLALLCANEQAELAQLYIRRLRDERFRAETLAYIQHYTPARSEPTWVKTLEARRDEVLQRPDVIAAVNAVGRIETWPFQAHSY